MNPSRVVQQIVRRLSSGDNLFTQISPTHSQVTTSPKQVDTDLTKNKRSLTTLNNTIIRPMATDTTVPSTSSSSVGHTPNRLALEKSPYLLQHATNPVDWYPWCDEAFEKAKQEDKLIFLSVGYSTCHWCHVMEKESFENDSVAEIMNQHFVNIKVDREERPDIDRVYMSFVQATSGSGGWPMSVFLTPNLEPITGGTYFPPEDKWGRPGFKTILKKVAEQWTTEKATILKTGKYIVSVLKKAAETESQPGAETTAPGLECMNRCIQQYSKSFEEQYGGFSTSPKFPQPSNFDFLFHVYSRDCNSVIGKQCLNMCLFTLKCMANGGIHDHVSNGFARYSTDTKWHVPHFEKMLYDQGQLVVSYCNAYVATKEQFYADIVRDILLYVSRDLSHETGGFYSAEDADSYPTADSTHKKEGAFCVWEFNEITQHLTGRTGGISDAEIFCHHYNVRKAGNVNPQQDPHNELTNKNVLIVFGTVEGTAEYFEIPVEKAQESLDKSLKILYTVRQQRPRPHLDSKILTAWNGLMITGFAKAGYFLKDKDYVDRAVKAANFIRKELYNENAKTLVRCCYRGDNGEVTQNAVPIPGFLDDYAFLIRALLDLYEATLDASWLEWAELLQDTQDQLFWDEEKAGYFTSPEGDASVLIRVKEDQDGAEPSGNSVSSQNLIRLGCYFERKDMKTKAARLLASFSERLQKIPIALPEMTSALMLHHDSPTQICIVGLRGEPGTEALLDVVRSRLLPGRILVVADGPEGLSSALYKRLDILAKLKAIKNKPTAYVCHHHACSLPVTEPEDLANLLEEDLRVQLKQ